MSNWYTDHDNLVLMTAWLADRSGTTALTVAYAVEKPWKYEGDFRLAHATAIHEGENPSGDCHIQLLDDTTIYCAAESCGWSAQWNVTRLDVVERV